MLPAMAKRACFQVASVERKNFCLITLAHELGEGRGEGSKGEQVNSEAAYTVSVRTFLYVEAIG
jgi:hypothetical protein